MTTYTTSLVPPAALDWEAFRAARFPGRRRHDLKAVTAYGTYRREAMKDAALDHSADDGRAGLTALRRWEDEGGA